MRRLLPVALALLLAVPAHAQAPADDAEEALCADRPGLATGTCTVEPGRVQVELAIDWSFQEDGADRTETLLAGDTVVRIGLDDRTEIQFGWTPFGSVRERAAGLTSTTDGVGDAFVGVRRRLHDRDGISVAVQGQVSLPVGGDAIGAGDWGAELIVPVGFEIGKTELFLAPSIATAPDADGSGRHVAYGLAAGYGFNLSERLAAVLDLAFTRDEDPLGHATEALAGIALAWTLNPNLQLDLGAVIGLSDAAADLEIYVGAAQRF